MYLSWCGRADKLACLTWTGWCRLVPIFIVLTVYFHQMAGQCNFPNAIQNNNFTSTSFGKIQFQVSTFDYAEDGVTSWTCHINSGNIYIIRSIQNVTSFGTQVHFYYCLDLTKRTDFSYSYYLRSTLLSAFNSMKRRKIREWNRTVTLSEVCDDTPDAAEFHVMVNEGSPASAKSYCASPLLGDFMYMFNDQFTGTEICGATPPGDGMLDVCTNSSRNVLVFNYTACSQQVAYSTGGVLYCIAYTSATSGSTTTYYQSLYNADASAVTQFTCLAVSFGTDMNGTARVFVSQIATSCSAGQNSTTAPLDSGDTLVLTANVTCPLTTSEDSETNVGLIAGLAVLGVLLLAGLAGLLFYFCYWKKRDPNAGKPIVENTKPKFEDPDNDDITDDVIDLDDNASTIVTRDDIMFEAGSPSLVPNGKPVSVRNGAPAGNLNKGSYVTFNGGLPNGSLDHDSGIALTERSSSNRPMPRIGINPSKETMVIFNGDEKVISGNDSRIVPADNPSGRTFRAMNLNFDPGVGFLSLNALEENEAGDSLSELTGRDLPYPSLPREKSNLMPPIETVDPENDKSD